MADANNPQGAPRSLLPRPSRLPVPTSLRSTPSREFLRAPAPPASASNPRQPSREPLGRTSSSNRNSVLASQPPALRPKASHDVFKKPTARPMSTQQPNASIVRRQPSQEVFKKPIVRPSSRQHMEAPLPNLRTSFDDPEPAAPSRPNAQKSLSERVQDTLASIPVPDSPEVRRRSSNFFNPESPMGPPARSGTGSRPGSSHVSDNMMRPPSRQSRPSSRQAGSRPASRQGVQAIPLNYGAASTPAKPSLQYGTPLKRTPGAGTLKTPGSVSNLRLASSPAPKIPAAPAGILTAAAPGSGIKSGTKTIGRTIRPRASINNMFDEPVVTATGPRSPAYQTIGRSPQPRQSINGYFDAAPVEEPSGSPLDEMPSRSSSLKPKTSVSGLYKKPSTSEMRQPQAAPVSAPSPAPLRLKKKLTAPKAAALPKEEERAESPSRTKAEAAMKSSQTLRETIAKAKAAKRAAMAGTVQPAAPKLDGPMSPILPTDSFDFGLNSAMSDPFGQNKGQDVGKGLLRKRIDAARTDGRLNIAAIGLKEIPKEVMDMYNLDVVSSQGGSWAESVDLVKFIAADNEFETISDDIFPDRDPRDMADDEDAQGSQFGGLEQLDLHGNILISIPMGLRRLEMLTVLNLSNNKLGNGVFDIISQIPFLRDLKLADNALSGDLTSDLLQLSNLENLDLHNNKLTSLPGGFSALTKLRSLNVSHNAIPSLPFESLRSLPLIELLAASNKLSGTLIEAENIRFASLRTLDVSANAIQLLSSGSVILPSLQVLNVSANRIKALPGMETWESLMTLLAADNAISAFPVGFTELPSIKIADFAGNDIKSLDDKIALMSSLDTLVISGNPLRERKFAGMTTVDLKRSLLARIEPEPVVGQEDEEQGFFHRQPPSRNGHNRERSFSNTSMVTAIQDNGDSASQTSDTVYLDAPSSSSLDAALPRSPGAEQWASNINASLGILDRSSTSSTSLNPLIAAQIAGEYKMKTVELHHNSFTEIPASIAFFGHTLTSLNLSHNALTSDTWLRDTLELPHLVDLNLSSNTFDSLSPLLRFLTAPQLSKVDISFNRMTSLPSPQSQEGTLGAKFPMLSILLASNNRLRELSAESVRGVRLLDVQSNEIERLDPRLGLLGVERKGERRLEKFEVAGNRFRVPNYRVVEKGTEGVLEWCRGRLGPEELGVEAVEAEGIEEGVEIGSGRTVEGRALNMSDYT